MKISSNKQKENKKVAQNSNKGGKNMIKNTQRTTEKFNRKLGTENQKNIIEMLSYIYLYPKSHTNNSLAIEFTKNGIVSKRKIIRMINNANAFCPIIKRVLGKIDFESHYYLDDKKFTETDIDNFYKKSQNGALLYIFLKSLLIKPMTTEDVMQKINVNRKTANTIINHILDATCLLYDIETDDGYIIGHINFFE